MKECNNTLVKTIDHGYDNSNSFIGNSLSFFRYKFGIDILNQSFKTCSRHVSQPVLSLEQFILLDQLKTLILRRANISVIHDFISFQLFVFTSMYLYWCEIKN